MSASASDNFRQLYPNWTGSIGAGGVADGVVTTIPLTSVTNLPTGTGINLVIDRVDQNGTKTPSKWETVRGIISGSNLIDVVRGVEGSAQAHSAGAVVELLLTADQMNAMNTAILVGHNQDGSHILDTDGTLTADSDTKIPSQKAVKTYADNISYGMARQAIVNGNFDVWQRGTSFSSIAGSLLTADRWYLYSGYTDRTISQQLASLNGSNYCLRVQRNNGSSNGGSDYLNYAALESKDGIKFSNQSVTLSFYARAGANYSPASSGLIVQLKSGTGSDESFKTGNFTTGNTNAINQVATLTTYWQKFSYTGTFGSIKQFSLLFGASWSGTAGANDYFEITQIQVCLGSVALPFQPKSFEEELMVCQIYSRIYNAGEVVWLGAGSPSANKIVSMLTFDRMRVAPTITNPTFSAADLDTNLITITSADAGNAYICAIRVSVNATVTAETPYMMGISSGSLILNAEL